MKIHHLNCASMCPHGGRWLQGEGGLFSRATIVCHCLLIEGRDGLILVDTGLGMPLTTRDLPLPKALMLTMQPVLDPQETALAQIQKLGFKAGDVRHIVPTHLDFDHAGALMDFPQAQVHVYDVELDAALAPRTISERQRYLKRLWKHQPLWQRHRTTGELWRGFEAVQALGGQDDEEVLIVPVVGHSRGHAAVAVKTGDGWLLHCGDAYFFHTEMAAQPHCPPGLGFFQTALAHDNAARRANQKRLHQAKHAHSDLTVFCAHCPHELRAHQVH